MSHYRRTVRNWDSETACTPDCMSPSHASVVLMSVALGNLRLVQHCQTVCSNAWRISDHFGRTPLHVAASRGHTHIAEWLVAKKKVAMDTVDGESGWTALHRSVYFGELGTAVSLVKLGAGLTVRDNEGLTALSLLNKDRFHMRETPDVVATDIYTWGRNANTTLGHAHSRPHPECLDLPSHFTITQVVLEKFHTVLLASSGVVLTCGHGMGGRLGHGTEASFVAPRVVEGLKGERCVSVAVARNHTVFLTDSGVVYSCGLNDAHQLGLGSAPKQCLTPTPITAKILRGRQVRGVGAGRYHTALATDSHVYTFGQNLGQLGYEKNSPTQILPKAVPQICVEGDDTIISLSASHAATAVLTKRHRIFVCTDFTVKYLRCGFLEKLDCRQFQVCASLTDRAHLRGTSFEPTKVLLLDSEKKLWYWEPGKRGTVPHILPGLAQYNVAHFTLGKNLTIVTDEGEAYLSLAQAGQPLSFSRLTSVQNASAIFTDFKATNFAYLQNINSVIDFPSVAPPTLTSDLCGLLKDDNILDSVADIQLQAGKEVVSAHRFILSRLSSHPLSSHTHTLTQSPRHILHALLHYLYGATIHLIPIPDESDSGSTLPTSLHVELTPDTSFASVDENDLTEMYDRFGSQSPPPQMNSLPLQSGFDEVELNLLDQFVQQSTPKKGGRRKNDMCDEGGCEVVEVRCVSVRKELQCLLKLANELEVPSLTHRLDEVLSHFSLKQAMQTIVLTPPHLSLSPSLSPSLTDVTLLTTDHQTLQCHKCVLVARSDSDSLEWIVQVLVTADQLLLTRLRDICELALAKKLSLRSVCEVAEVAEACSTPQLKTACLQFISANAAALLETRVLDSLRPSLLPELSVVYKEIVPQTSKRIIKFPDPQPSVLPASYFLDDGEKDYNEDEEEEAAASVHSAIERQSDMRSPPPESTAQYNSRRRRRDSRRRKSSQSESRKSRDSGGHGSISPSPTPTSPPVTLSPLPLSHSPSSPEDDNATKLTSPLAGTNKNHPPKETGFKPDPETGLTTPNSSSVKSAERGSSRLNRKKSRSKTRKKLSDNYEGGERATEREKETLREKEKETLTGREKETAREREKETMTEREMEREKERATERVKETAREREKETSGEREKERKAETEITEGLTNGLPSHMQQTPAKKKAWGKGESQQVSLKDIMAEEEKEMAAQNSPPSPTSPPTRHTSLPPSRQTSCDSAHTPQLSSSVPRSPPSNPWQAAQLSPSPPVSLRDLMAEETRRAENMKKCRPPSSSSSSPHSTQQSRRPSVVQPKPPVSFADIILSQQREQEAHSSRTRKPLSCIQIEQQAINQLEALYGCHDNPDEYITVQRHTPRPSHTHHPLHHHHPTSHTHTPLTSPWNAH